MALSTPRQANGQRRFNWAEMICYTIDESPEGKLFVQDLFERMVKKYPELRDRAPEFNWEARVKNRIKSPCPRKITCLSNFLDTIDRVERVAGGRLVLMLGRLFARVASLMPSKALVSRPWHLVTVCKSRVTRNRSRLYMITISNIWVLHNGLYLLMALSLDFNKKS